MTLSFIKHACVAGEPLNPEVYNKIKELTGLELHEGFGQSETPVMLANFGFFPVRPARWASPAPCFHIDLPMSTAIPARTASSAPSPSATWAPGPVRPIPRLL